MIKSRAFIFLKRIVQLDFLRDPKTFCFKKKMGRRRGCVAWAGGGGGGQGEEGRPGGGLLRGKNIVNYTSFLREKNPKSHFFWFDH